MDRSPSRRDLAVTALLPSGLMAIACGGRRDSTSSGVPVRIALTNVPIAYLPVILAQELGYYRQEGLSVTVDDFSSASKVMQALLAGSADVAAGSYEQDIQMAAEERRVKAFVLMLRYPSRVLVVVPQRAQTIRRTEDLRGATVGVAGLGSTNHLFLNYVLLQHGVRPEEVKPVAIGTAASAVAAMQHGQVDAAVLVGSEFPMVSRRIPGLATLLDARGAVGARGLYGVEVYPTTVLHATEDWLRKHPDTARRLAQSILRTLRWIRDHSAEEVLDAMPERYRLPDREADLEALRTTIPGFSTDGLMPVQGAEAVRKAQAFSLEKVRHATFALSETYTNEFVQILENRSPRP